MQHYIFEAVAWGGDDPDDIETMYLVRAASFKEAAECADQDFWHQRHLGTQNFSKVIHEVGISLGNGPSPRILRGPYRGRAYGFCSRQWIRHERDGEWEELEATVPE